MLIFAEPLQLLVGNAAIHPDSAELRTRWFNSRTTESIHTSRVFYGGCHRSMTQITPACASKSREFHGSSVKSHGRVGGLVDVCESRLCLSCWQRCYRFVKEPSYKAVPDTMRAVIAQRPGDQCQVIDEIALRNSNTQEMME